VSNSGESLYSIDACESVTGAARGWHEEIIQPFPASFESRLLVTSLQAQVEEIARLAAATGSILTRLIDHSGPVGPLSDEVLRTIPRWHFAMLNDHERNDALAVALERRIVPGSSVLDIGSGTGLLAMMAVRAGAGRVVGCETNPVMAEIARQVVAAHGMADIITIVTKRSTDVRVGPDLDKPVDFIVSEIVDCGLIGEGLLPTMVHAREHLLAPGGQILPESGRIFGFLLDSPVATNLNRVGAAGGFDVRLLNVAATQGHFPIRLSTWPHHVLSETVELARFRLLEGPLDNGHREISLPVTASGTAQSLVAWFELDLGAGVVLRNSPDNLGSHWMQALIPFPHPREVTAGTTVTAEVRWDTDRMSVTDLRSPQPWRE
jgi:type II protein arginine methyltransferase